MFQKILFLTLLVIGLPAYGVGPTIIGDFVVPGGIDLGPGAAAGPDFHSIDGGDVTIRSGNRLFLNNAANTLSGVQLDGDGVDQVLLSSPSTTPAQIKFQAGAGIFSMGYVDIGSGRTFIAPAFDGGTNQLTIGFGTVTSGIPANSVATFNRDGNVDIDSLTLSGSSTALTHYETGTFSATCTNCANGPYTMKYVRVGDQVCLRWPQTDVVLSGTAFPIFAGIPSQIRSTAGFQTFLVPLQVNGTRRIAFGGIYASDRLDLYEDWLTNDTTFPSGATLIFSGTTGETNTVCWMR